MSKYSPKRTGDSQIDRNLDEIARILNVISNKLQDNGNIRVQGSLGVGNNLSATTLGAVSGKIEVFDKNGNSLGFLPIYATIS